jgi:uncharacterized membrane protein
LSESLLTPSAMRHRLAIAPVLAFAAATLMLAGAIHICAILLVPVLARSDGWSQLLAFAGDARFAEVPLMSAASDGVLGLDPLFVTGACRVRLADSAADLLMEAPGHFWSLALYDADGTIVFSLNDRTAVDGRLDMRVGLRGRLPADAGEPAGDRIDVVSDSADLIALLRLFAPTPSARSEARQLLATARCREAS